MNGLHVRSAQEADAADIARILRGTGWFEHMAVEGVEETERRIRHHLRGYLADDGHSLYVADSGNRKVVGYAAVHWHPNLFLPAPEGYLSELFVDEAHRGKGIGRALLDAVAGEARRRNCSRLMLVTSRVRESYRRRFYSSAGWIEREGIANFVLDLTPASSGNDRSPSREP